MAATFTIISSTTISTNTPTVTISGIPSTYDDLWVKIYARSTGSSNTDNFEPVIGTGARLGLWIVGKTSGTSTPYLTTPTYTNFGGDLDTANNAGDAFGYSEIYIGKYANATYRKPVLTQAGSVSNVSGTASDYAYSEFIAGLSNTAEAVSTLTFNWNSGQFTTGSIIDVYGIKNS